MEEPANYVEAIKDNEWNKVMKRELKSIEKNKTWRLTELSAGQKVIGLKWVFKLKKDTIGEILKIRSDSLQKGMYRGKGLIMKMCSHQSHA